MRATLNDGRQLVGQMLAFDKVSARVLYLYLLLLIFLST